MASFIILRLTSFFVFIVLFMNFHIQLENLKMTQIKRACAVGYEHSKWAILNGIEESHEISVSMGVVTYVGLQI
jgi:hypothetical protein